MKRKRLKAKDVGRFVRVGFDDVGASDGIITQVDGPNDFRFLPLHCLIHGAVHNNGADVLAIGNYVSAIKSGLDR